MSTLLVQEASKISQEAQNFPSEFDIEFHNIMATPSEVENGECTWCKSEFSGDNVHLMERCEFHNRETER